MMLFGAQVPANIGSVVKITPRYAVETDDDGKTVKDDNGVAVLKKDDNGQHIVLAERIGLLPRKSKDNPDMADATGLTGQGLMQFEREARDVLFDSAIAEMVRLRSSGQYTFASGNRSRKSGAITLVAKPVFGGKSIAAANDDELEAEMERRGYKVDKTAKSNGKPDGELELEAKPKSGKK